MAGQPLPDRRALVGGLVVTDQVQIQLGWSIDVDGPEKPQELLVSAPTLMQTYDLAGRNVQGREQSCGAMVDIIMGAAFGRTWHHRQHGRGAIGRLHLRSLVDGSASIALSGGCRYNPTTPRTLSMNNGRLRASTCPQDAVAGRIPARSARSPCGTSRSPPPSTRSTSDYHHPPAAPLRAW